MDIIELKRLLYKNREIIIKDLNIDPYRRCDTCIYYEHLYEDCYNYCQCNHDECIDCNMECHNNCPCDCEHDKCDNDECDGECHNECSKIYFGKDLVWTIMTNAFLENGIECFEKYNKLFNSNNIFFEDPYYELLAECLLYRLSNDEEIIKKSFDKITSSNLIKNYNYIYGQYKNFGGLLCLNKEIWFLDKLIGLGCDVNQIFVGGRTVISSLIDFNEGINYAYINLKLIEYFLNKGFDINNFNKKEIFNYEYFLSKPYRIKIIEYLIGKGMKISNTEIYKVMLWNKELGTILESFSRNKKQFYDINFNYMKKNF
jgi:hypothetical protein